MPEPIVRLVPHPDLAAVDLRVMAPTLRDQLVRAVRTILSNGHRLRLLSDGVTLPASAAHLLQNGLPGFELEGESGRRFVANRAWARASHDRTLQQLRRLVTGGAEVVDRALGDAPRLRPLDPHQRLNVAAMTLPGSVGLCVFDEQGAGKTVTTLFAFDRLFERGEVDLALIVAPKSMVPEWKQDCERFFGDLYRVQMLMGDRREKATAAWADAEVLVTNFETVVSLEHQLASRIGSAPGGAMLVIDESFFVKNRASQRTGAARRVREHCTRTFVLCGTPAPNSAIDLVEQFNTVDFGVAFDGERIPSDRAAAQARVGELVAQRGLYVRHLKADVLPDLPPRQVTRLRVSLSPQQRELYDRLSAGLVADLREIDEETFARERLTFMQRRTALLQVCSCPWAVDPAYDEAPGKSQALDSLLVELVGQRREKVVVWAFFRETLEHLTRRYRDYGLVRYDGTITAVDERREAIRAFQHDEDVRLFVGNPAAAGAGITLHAARYSVYVALSNQAGHYLQSLDRIHRRGQMRPVESIVLLAEETIELTEFDRLERKQLEGRHLLGDEDELLPTRDELLHELLTARER